MTTKQKLEDALKAWETLTLANRRQRVDLHIPSTSEQIAAEKAAYDAMMAEIAANGMEPTWAGPDGRVVSGGQKWYRGKVGYVSIIEGQYASASLTPARQAKAKAQQAATRRLIRKTIDR